MHGKAAMGKLMRALGLMSGTSLDGIDVALIETDGESQVRARPGDDVSPTTGRIPARGCAQALRRRAPTRATATSGRARWPTSSAS